MKASRQFLPLLLLLGAFSFGALAQDTNPGQDPGQTPQGRGPGQRGNRNWGGGAMFGRGVVGTVTQVAADHFIIKTENGELYTVHYSVNTRIAKGGSMGPRRGEGTNSEPPANPPQIIKAADIKAGDVITALGELDASAKSVGAVAILQLDPERVKQMREMQANYGKTWLAGRVTSINDTAVTLQGGPDQQPHTFVADENTTFRKMGEPITLGDIQVGEMVRTEGAIKNGAFLATTVSVVESRRSRGASPAPQ